MNCADVDNIRDILKIQCSDGNWNHDPYMHGLANGMIMIMAMIEGEEPVFLQAPEEWIGDKPESDSPPETIGMERGT